MPDVSFEELEGLEDVAEPVTFGLRFVLNGSICIIDKAEGQSSATLKDLWIDPRSVNVRPDSH